MAKQPRDLGKQGKPAPGAPTQMPKQSGFPSATPAKLNQGFRGTHQPGTGSNDSRKAR